MTIRNRRHCNSSFEPRSAGWKSNSRPMKEMAMTRLLAPTSILLAVIFLAANVPPLAVGRTLQIEVEDSLKGTGPSNWGVRASWRDQPLGVVVEPPVHETFH